MSGNNIDSSGTLMPLESEQGRNMNDRLFGIKADETSSSVQRSTVATTAVNSFVPGESDF